MKPLKGLNRDVAHVDQLAGTYRRARNMILDDLAGAMANERAPELLPALDGTDERFASMQICGQFKVPGDRVIFAVHFRYSTEYSVYDANKAEQVLEMLPDGTFTEIALGPQGTFGFDAGDPFQGVGYVNGAGNLVLVYTDGFNKPRYIQYTGTPSTEPFLVFPEAKFPMARPVKEGANDTTGNILAGNYTFMIAYEVQDGSDNLTQYGPSMGSYQIGAGNTDENLRFRGSAKMKFYGLDTSYNYARVYAIRDWQGTETVIYADRFAITDEDQEWTFTGQEVTNTASLTTDALLIPRLSYTSAQTVAVSDDRMFLANLSTDDISYEEGQAVANNISVHWTTDEEGLYSFRWDLSQLDSPDPFSQVILNSYDLRITDYTSLDWSPSASNRNGADNELNIVGGQNQPDDFQGMLGGFMPGEVYALYIAFLKKDGTWTQAFHIPGGGDDGDYSSAARLNTATVAIENVDINQGSGTWNMHVSGRPGYTVNTADEYSSAQVWVDEGLDNTGVRHHLMPTAKQLWQSVNDGYGGESDMNVSPYSHEWCNQTLGLYFDNVVIPASIANKVQGYKMFYAKPQSAVERRIKAYVPTWRHDDDRLRIYDPYLLFTKPQVSDWDIEEVYKRMSYLEQGGHTMQSASIEDYAYLPNNVIYGDFDNEFRESVLGIAVSGGTPFDVDPSTVWDAGYPGFTAGTHQEKLGVISVTARAGGGWHVQSSFDQKITPPEDSNGLSVVNDNFASALGGFHNTVGTVQQWGYDHMPSKNSVSYGAVYEHGDQPGNSGSTYYRADAIDAGTASGDLPDTAYLGWGGMMGSMSVLYRDEDSYHVDYANRPLAATHDLVRVDGAGTYKSNQPVRGGDTWIAPVVVEFMHGGDTANTANVDANPTTGFDTIGKCSYFTWTHILPSKNDLDGYLDTQDLADSWGVASGKTFYNGETLNNFNFGQHWSLLNEKKSAYPAIEGALESNNYPNRIIRSNKQNYESTKVAWTQFAAADYYDNALGKGPIQNIEDYQGDIIIHHEDAIFKTRSKFNFDASGMSVFVGTGDIFQAPPQELFVDAAGYAGISHWSHALLSRAGYTWVDLRAGRIFNLTNGLEELSANGLRNFMREEFVTAEGLMNNNSNIFESQGGGFTIGFDPENDRLLFSKRYTNSVAAAGGALSYATEGQTLSYSLRNKCWVSNHTYWPFQYFQTYNNLFMWNEVDNGGYSLSSSTNDRGGVFKINAAVPGTNYNADGTVNDTPDTSFVDCVFNMGGAASKVWQNFNWVTRNGEDESNRDRTVTFDRARVYNDDQCSFENSNFRLTDNRWQWNEFRDDSLAGATGWFTNLENFRDNNAIMDDTKQWYERQRFVSEFLVIRLETLNTDGNRLYLLDVGATARKARR